jgi:hypothetical protein
MCWLRKYLINLAKLRIYSVRVTPSDTNKKLFHRAVIIYKIKLKQNITELSSCTGGGETDRNLNFYFQIWLSKHYYK